MTHQRENILNKITALLAKTVENGASEAEAETALQMAQKLMAKNMIEEADLQNNKKDRKCVKQELPIFKTGYDTSIMNGAIGQAFDCKVWWNSYKKEVYFFGFNDDSKLAAYFYNYLNNMIVNEAEKYKKSREYAIEKELGYHGKTIMASFIKGLCYRLSQRLLELRASRQDEVKSKTGTDLVILKDQVVKSEFDNLDLKIRNKKLIGSIKNINSFSSGREKADAINLSGGIGKEDAQRISG